jgi:hypothetical protein
MNQPGSKRLLQRGYTGDGAAGERSGPPLAKPVARRSVRFTSGKRNGYANPKQENTGSRKTDRPARQGRQAVKSRTRQEDCGIAGRIGGAIGKETGGWIGDKQHSGGRGGPTLPADKKLHPPGYPFVDGGGGIVHQFFKTGLIRSRV